MKRIKPPYASCIVTELTKLAGSLFAISVFRTGTRTTSNKCHPETQNKEIRGTVLLKYIQLFKTATNTIQDKILGVGVKSPYPSLKTDRVEDTNVSVLP